MGRFGRCEKLLVAVTSVLATTGRSFGIVSLEKRNGRRVGLPAAAVAIVMQMALARSLARWLTQSESDRQTRKCSQRSRGCQVDVGLPVSKGAARELE